MKLPGGMKLPSAWTKWPPCGSQEEGHLPEDVVTNKRGGSRACGFRHTISVREGREKPRVVLQLVGFPAHIQILETLTRTLFLKLCMHKLEKIAVFHIEEWGREVYRLSHQHVLLSASSAQISHGSTRSLPGTGSGF